MARHSFSDKARRHAPASASSRTNPSGVDAITVVTVTRGRAALLRRATQSLAGQDVDEPMRHLVLVDDCAETEAEIYDHHPQIYEQSDVLSVGRMVHERTGPARLGYLRNLSIRLATTRWIAFLDDDNELEHDHLGTLLGTARTTNRPAVHSQRRLYLPDGAPFTEPIFPWCRDPWYASAEYERLRAAGVFVSGDNIVRDAVDPDRGVQMVDMGEWLLERALLATIGFQEEYSMDDWENVVPEDNKLLSEFVRREVPIGSSGRATLRYYMGGYSNSAMTSTEQPADSWSP